MRSNKILHRLLCTAAAVLGLAGAASTAGAQVVISQISPGGGSSPSSGVAGGGNAEYIADFVELHNNSDQAVSLAGWSLQSGTATANVTTVISLQGVIEPGGYYLVQLATPANFVGFRGLPFPVNASSSVNLAATGGKLAVVRNSTVALNVSDPGTLTDLVSDFVGWGNANASEGAAAPALTSNSAGLRRRVGGCTDTGSNAADFEVVTVTAAAGALNSQPRNTLSAASLCASVLPVQVCCNTQTGACVVTLASAACPSGTVAGAGLTSCLPTNLCPDPVGGCCINLSCSLATRALCLATGGVFLGAGDACPAGSPCQPPAVRISQIYTGGGESGGVFDRDFVELFNAGTTAVDLTDWSLQYASAGGQFTQRVNFLAGASIPPGSYYLIRLGGGTTMGLTTFSGDFNPTTTFGMATNSGRLALVTGRTPPPVQLANCPGLPRADVADYVGFGDSGGPICFELQPTGTQLGVSTAAYRRGDGCIDTDNNGNDFIPNPLRPTLRSTSGTVGSPAVAIATPVNGCTATLGACCTGVACAVTSEAGCTGIFLGLGTPCSYATGANLPTACGQPIGRCCVATLSCSVLTEADCRSAAVAAGLSDYEAWIIGGTCASGSGGTLVSNLCVGVCCVGSACTLTTRDQCVGPTAYWTTNTRGIQGVGVTGAVSGTCSVNVCAVPVPVQAGDILYGASVGQNYDSVWQIRDAGTPAAPSPQRVGTITRYNNVQFLAFDNSFNSPKNARGNLLGMDFGSIGGGATIFNLATNGDLNAGSIIYRLQAGNVQNPFNVPTGRYGTLAVSPGNRYVATVGYDNSRVVIFEYAAGPTPGTGAGASFTNAWTVGNAFGFGPTDLNFSPLFNSGAVWLDDSTLVVLVRNANPGFPGAPLAPALFTIPMTPTGPGTPVFRTAVPDGGIDSSRVMSLAYNPAVSPFLYASSSSFAGTTSNVLSIVDPRPSNWVVMRGLATTASLQTGRSLVVGNDRFLYFSQFAGTGQNAGASLIDRLNLDRNNDGVVDSSGDPLANLDVIAIPDNLGSSTTPADPVVNTTVNYFLKASTDQNTNSFNSLEIALTSSTGSVVCCRGVTCALVANAAACIAPAGIGTRPLPASNTSCTGQSAVNSGCCYADFTKDGNKDVADIFAFLSAWFANSPFSDVGGDGTGTRDVSDIFQFLSAWFAGCT